MFFLLQEQGNQLKTIYIHRVDERRPASVGTIKTRNSWDTWIQPGKDLEVKGLEDNFRSQNGDLQFPCQF